MDAFAKFKSDHAISNDVLIEVPKPNEVVVTVQGNNDWVLVQIWLFYHARL